MPRPQDARTGIGLRTTDGTATYQPPRRMAHWKVELTCPRCGGILAHQADGRPTPTTARAIARCTQCQRIWAAELTLTDVTTAAGSRPAHREDCECRPCQRRNAA